MTADWVSLTTHYPLNDVKEIQRSWAESTRTCSKVLSSIDLRVLYTEVGKMKVPIVKIVGAELKFHSRSISAARCHRNLNGQAHADESCKTVLPVTATVTFANLEAETFEYIPADPQIIPPLPYDFFYPFHR